MKLEKGDIVKLTRSIRVTGREIPKGAKGEVDKLVNLGYPVSFKINMFKYKNLVLSETHLEKIEDEKFEVGEEVLINFGYKKLKGEIFGIADKKDHFGRKYSVTYTNQTGKIINTTLSEEIIEKIKAKDELEKGDRFVGRHGREVEIINKEWDDYYDEIRYFGKAEDGLVSTWETYEIDEVIQ